MKIYEVASERLNILFSSSFLRQGGETEFLLSSLSLFLLNGLILQLMPLVSPAFYGLKEEEELEEEEEEAEW